MRLLFWGYVKKYSANSYTEKNLLNTYFFELY